MRKPKLLPLVVAVVLASGGCARMPVQKSFSGSSPADPAAAESSFPRAMPLLMAGTNFAMSAQGDGQSMTNHPEQTTGNAHEHRQH